MRRATDLYVEALGLDLDAKALTTIKDFMTVLELVLFFGFDLLLAAFCFEQFADGGQTAR